MPNKEKDASTRKPPTTPSPSHGSQPAGHGAHPHGAAHLEDHSSPRHVRRSGSAHVAAHSAGHLAAQEDRH